MTLIIDYASKSDIITNGNQKRDVGSEVLIGGGILVFEALFDLYPYLIVGSYVIGKIFGNLDSS